jgi:hypothetical protein
LPTPEEIDAADVFAVRSLEIPRSHDLGLLIRLLDSTERELPVEIREADWLNPWAVALRYDHPAPRSIAGWRLRLRTRACVGLGTASTGPEGMRMAAEHPRPRSDEPVDRLVDSFTRQQLVEVVLHALLSDADRDLAWDVAIAAPPDELDTEQWLRLAESREAAHPGDALAVYQVAAGEVLHTADRRASYDGLRILTRAARAADAAGRGDDYSKQIGRLREQYRRRPTLIAMLDKAGFV